MKSGLDAMPLFLLDSLLSKKSFTATFFIFYLQAVSTTERTSSIFDCELWLSQSKEYTYL